MEIAIKVLQLILSLSLLVFVHELGHYLSARMFGIRVDRFFLFFDAGGFALFKIKIGDTTFGIGWVPFGGYCSIAGMIDERLDTKSVEKPAESWEFRSHPAWQRLIVMVSGVVMNVLTALIIYIGMSWHWGDSYIANEDLRWGYSYNSLAHEIGFEDGDRVVSLDSRPVEGNYAKVYVDMVVGGADTVGVLRGDVARSIAIPVEATAQMLGSADFMTPRVPFVVAQVPEGNETGLEIGDSLVAFCGRSMTFLDQYRTALLDSAGRNVALEVVRDTTRLTVVAPVSTEGTLGVGVEGIARYYPVHEIKYGFGAGIAAGFRKTGSEISGYWDQLKMIVSPKTEAYKSVGSLLSIGNIFPGQWDWYSFWRITAFLSIILAVMNILPIPALDGGHAIFAIWEIITRRRPSDKFLIVMQWIGMVLLIGLMVLAFGNDIYRFFIK